MILNSESVELVRTNGARLAESIRQKDDLAELATAANFEQVLFAIEGLLTNTNMYFDDELLSLLSEDSWRTFKALLMVYTLNVVNKNLKCAGFPQGIRDSYREFIGATSQA